MEPWLPFGDAALNVAAQEADPRSMLALHRRLLALRRSSDDLLEGAYATVRRPAGCWCTGAARGRGRAEPDRRAGPAPVSGTVLLTTELDGREGELVEGSLALRPARAR